MKALATQIEKGFIIKSNYSNYWLRVDYIRETTKQIIFEGNYVHPTPKELVGKIWGYAFRKTTMVTYKIAI